jgi:hypothetical protein
MTEEAHFLREKGLYDQCLRRLKKARVVAEEHEYFYQLMEILDLERRLIKQTQDADLLETLDQLDRKQEETMQAIDDELKYARLHDLLFRQSRLGMLVRSDLPAPERELLDHLLHDPLPADKLSLGARIHLHSSLGFYFNLHKDYARSLAEFQDIVGLCEEHPALIDKNPDTYKILLSNLLAAANAADRHELFPPTLAKIRALPSLSFDEEAESFQNLTYLELVYCLNSGQFDAIPELAGRADAGLDEYAAKINQARMLAICMNFSLGFFIREEMRQALSWLGRILNHKSGDQRQDIQQAARILQLVIHLELGNHDLIHSLLRSTRRYLNLRQGMRDYEKALIDFFRIAIDLPPGKAMHQLYHETISHLEQLQSDTTWGDLLLCQEITIWLRARKDGVALREAFAPKSQQVP